MWELSPSARGCSRRRVRPDSCKEPPPEPARPPRAPEATWTAGRSAPGGWPCPACPGASPPWAPGSTHRSLRRSSPRRAPTPPRPAPWVSWGRPWRPPSSPGCYHLQAGAATAVSQECCVASGKWTWVVFRGAGPHPSSPWPHHRQARGLSRSVSRASRRLWIVLWSCCSPTVALSAAAQPQPAHSPAQNLIQRSTFLKRCSSPLVTWRGCCPLMGLPGCQRASQSSEGRLNSVQGGEEKLCGQCGGGWTLLEMGSSLYCASSSCCCRSKCCRRVESCASRSSRSCREPCKCGLRPVLASRYGNRFYLPRRKKTTSTKNVWEKVLVSVATEMSLKQKAYNINKE